MVFVLDHLAIGNYEEALKSPPEITALLCVAGEHDVAGTSLAYDKVPIADFKSIPVHLLKSAVEFIASHIEDKRILVFCHGGVGRAPSVVIAYLCCVQGYGFGEAVEFVATRKPRMSILPNLITGIAEVKRLFEEEKAAQPSV